MSTLVGIVIALIPFLGVVGLLRLADRIAGRRERLVARQIALTDAIHRELGAVTAPVVRRGPGGAWSVSMTVPQQRPGIAAALVRITERMFLDDATSSGAGRADRLRIVLMPHEVRSAADSRLRPRRGPLDAPTPALPALR